MSDATGQHAEAFQLLSGESLILRSFEIGRVDAGADDAVNATGGISNGDEVRVEMPASARQIQFIVVVDGRTRLDTTAIVCNELGGEFFGEHVFDEFAGNLCIGKAHRLLLGRVESREPEPAIGGDINQEHTYRNVVECFFVQLVVAQRVGMPVIDPLNGATDVDRKSGWQ